MQNQFAWWPQVQEKFSENYDKAKDPLSDLEWNELKFDWWGIYWSFNKSENLEQEKKQLSEKVSNSPDFPTIERLYTSWKISTEKYETFIEDIESNNWELSEDSNEELSNFLDNNLSLDEKVDSFKKDMKESKVLSDFFDWIDSKAVDSIEFQLYKIVWENYSKFDIWEWNYDIEKDVSTAINVSANKIITLHKTLNKDSQTYKNAIKDIRWWDLNEKLMWLKSLCILSFTTAWSLSKKTENQRKNISENINSRKQYLIDKIQELKEKVINENNLEKRKKYELDLEDLKLELKELKSGEVFNSSELDSSNESWETPKENPKPSRPIPRDPFNNWPQIMA